MLLPSPGLDEVGGWAWISCSPAPPGHLRLHPHTKASSEESRKEWQTSKAHWKPCESHHRELEVWNCMQTGKPSAHSHANHPNLNWWYLQEEWQILNKPQAEPVTQIYLSQIIYLSIQNFLHRAQYSKCSVHSCCQTTVSYTLLISNCAPKYNIQKSKSHGTCPSLAWKNISLNLLQMPTENKLTWCFLWKPPIFFTVVLWNVQRGRNDKNTDEKFIMKVKGIFAGYIKLKVGTVQLQQEKKTQHTSVPMSGRAGYNVRKRKAVKNEQ